jgi:hypothetical protein
MTPLGYLIGLPVLIFGGGISYFTGSVLWGILIPEILLLTPATWFFFISDFSKSSAETWMMTFGWLFLLPAIMYTVFVVAGAVIGFTIRQSKNNND